MKKVFYWSPHLSNVATIKNVVNSAYSLKKYNSNLQVSIIDVIGEWAKFKNIFKIFAGASWCVIFCIWLRYGAAFLREPAAMFKTL